MADFFLLHANYLYKRGGKIQREREMKIRPGEGSNVYDWVVSQKSRNIEGY